MRALFLSLTPTADSEMHIPLRAVSRQRGLSLGLEGRCWAGPCPMKSHWIILCECVIAQSCLILRDPVDSSQLGASVRGILQTRILEWVAMPSSRGMILLQNK